MSFVCVERATEPGQHDRPLLKSGAFADGAVAQTDIEDFHSARAAIAAGERASNRKPGAQLAAIGGTR